MGKKLDRWSVTLGSGTEGHSKFAKIVVKLGNRPTSNRKKSFYPKESDVYKRQVVDYVHLKVINFAVFNFADICVTVGTAMLLVYLLFYELRHKNKETAGETKGA